METRDVAEGMTVRAADGRELGRVAASREGSFTVEKGAFFPRELTIRHDQIAEVRDGEVYLKVSDLDRAAIAEGDPGEGRRAGTVPGPSASGMGAGALGAAGLGTAGGPAGAGLALGVRAVEDIAKRDEPPPGGSREDER